VKAREKCARRTKKGLGDLAEGSRETFLHLSACRNSPLYSLRRSTFYY